MRREGGSGGLDRFRVLAALLVAANHTSPLLDRLIGEAVGL